MEFRVQGLGFIEIVKGLGANNVLGETFWPVFFLNHILHLKLGAGQGGGAGLGWALGWGAGPGFGGPGRAGPETEIGTFENGNWATEKFWAKRFGQFGTTFCIWDWVLGRVEGLGGAGLGGDWTGHRTTGAGGSGWLGLVGWLGVWVGGSGGPRRGWAIGLALRAGPETEIGLFENGNWAKVLGETFWAVFFLEPHFASGAGCWAGWRGWAGGGLGAGGCLGVAGLLAGLALRTGPETEIGLCENGNIVSRRKI